jgi:heptosyltransferase-3
MRVLFITSSRIGDAVLSTGLLNYIAQNHPDAKVTIVCGPLAAPLFEGYPKLEKLVALQKKSFHRHWLGLWIITIGTKWDVVIDLRNSAVSRLVRAKQRFIFGKHIDQELHKVEQAAATMKLSSVPSPQSWFSAKQNAKAKELVPDGGPVLGVGPAANWQGKTWPAENFIEIVKHITAPDGLLPGARVAVFAAPGEEDIARRVLNSVPENKRIDVIAKGNPGEAAAALARCAFYIGNDSGLMHSAAAAGIPTLGLFGPSWPHLYRPWGARADYISTPENYDQLIAYPGYSSKTAPSLMTTLTVDAVKAKLEDFRNELKKAV